MLRTTRVFAVVLACSAVSTVTRAQTTGLRVETPRVARNEQLRIVLPPAAKDVTSIALVRNGGRTVELDAVVVPAVAPDTSPRLVATIDPDVVPLGDYTVSVVADKVRLPVSGLITVLPSPNAQVHVLELTPPNTYDWRASFVPTGTQTESVPVRRVRLPTQPAAIAITIGGARVWPYVIWDGCDHLPPLPSKEVPADDIQVYGARDNKGHATELCNLPVEATVTASGESMALDESDTQKRLTAEIWSLKGESRPVNAFGLVLRGSGFQMERRTDNEIWIDDVRQRILWDSCSHAEASIGKPNAPQPLRMHGEVISAEEIRLCGIEVPASGELRIAAGFGDTKSEVRRFNVFSLTAGEVTWRAALVALLLALLPLALLLGRRRVARHAGKAPSVLRALFLDPETNTYSLSKLQFYLWTAAALFGYTYLFISRVHVQNGPLPDVPGTLPGIIAVSGGTAIGSQVVTSVKGSKGAGEEAPSISDFVVSGGVVAADRVQMLVWTFLGVGAFIAAIVRLGPGTISDLPAVPEKLLYLMGLSSAGYLGGKIARKAGPVISELSVTPSDSDEILSQGQSMAPMPDITQPIADARTALTALPALADVNAKLASTSLQDAISAAAGAHTSDDFTKLLDTLERKREAAEKAAADVARDAAAAPPKAAAQDASGAQAAAAAIQQLAAATIQAVASVSALQMDAISAPSRADRTIDLRGTNLSPDALLQIDHIDLPFRMLMNRQGQHAPEMIMRDDTNPTFARLLRVSIMRATLDTVDQQQADAWFAKRGTHKFTIVNPDGQKADVSFAVPPGEAQKGGTT